MVAAQDVAKHGKAAYNSLKEVIKDRPVLINRAPTLHKYSIVAMNPVLTKGRSLQIPPALVGPLGADFDGDTMSYSVPVSQEAVKQARDIMMPNRNLISNRNDRPTYMPSNEYLQGLYFASKEPTAKPTRTFATKDEALAAYKKGEINIDDPILIKGE